MIYSYFGTNKFLKDEQIKKLITEFEKRYTALAIDHFNGEEMTKEVLIDAISTAPFLTEKKMVIINQLGANKTLSEKIVRLLEMTASTTDLVLVENNFDSKSALHNYLKKHSHWQLAFHLYYPSPSRLFHRGPAGLCAPAKYDYRSAGTTNRCFVISLQGFVE